MAEHLFCPRSGNLVRLNIEKQIIQCQSSGYERGLQGVMLAWIAPEATTRV